MNDKVRIIRFNIFDRLFHLFIMVTFLVQAVTGLGRLLYVTTWGKGVVNVFGGYDRASTIHNTVGILMLIGFAVHIAYILAKVKWRDWRRSLFSPDSLVPRLEDLKQAGLKIRWFFGLGPPPAFDCWTYWEKFDY
jgi:Ni,Fe-hydrogenase I cytochrome b subunit